MNLVHLRVTKSCKERVHEAKELLGEQVLYFDMYVKKRPGLPNPTFGDFRGEFVSEMDTVDHIVVSVASGDFLF